MKSTLATNDAIQHSALRLRWAVFAAMALMLLVYVAARLDLRVAQAHIAYQNHAADARFARPIGDVSMALLMIALFRLTQMLRRIAMGELFSVAVVRRFRGFALWLLLMAVFELLAPIFAVLVTPAPGLPHQMRILLDLRDLLTVGTTLLLFLLARLLERARRLDEEMREFV